MNGVDDRRHLHTITSPAAETIMDSVRDIAREHCLAKRTKSCRVSIAFRGGTLRFLVNDDVATFVRFGFLGGSCRCVLAVACVGQSVLLSSEGNGTGCSYPRPGGADPERTGPL